mgnify:CR=1 FL=1
MLLCQDQQPASWLWKITWLFLLTVGILKLYSAVTVMQYNSQKYIIQAVQARESELSNTED